MPALRSLDIEFPREEGEVRSRLDRSVRERGTARLLIGLAILAACGLTSLTVLLARAVWNDMVTSNGMISIQPVIALVILLWVNPFLVLGVNAMVNSPVDTYRAARGFVRHTSRQPKTVILVLVACAFMTAVAISAAFVLFQAVGHWAGVTIRW
jgi:hypothetical protein